MDFKVEGLSNSEKYCWSLLVTIVGWQEKLLNSRRPKMAKTVTF